MQKQLKEYEQEMKRQIIGSLEEELKKQNEHQLKTLEREYKEEISQLEF